MGKNKKHKKAGVVSSVPVPKLEENGKETALPDLDSLMRSEKTEPVENLTESVEKADALSELDFGQTEPADIPTPAHTDPTEMDLNQFAPAEEEAPVETKHKRGKKKHTKSAEEMEFVPEPVIEVVEEKPEMPESTDDGSSKEDPTKTAGPVRIVVTLMVICGIVALLLSAVNAVTKDVIAENSTKKQSEAILRIFTEGTDVVPYADTDNVWLVYQNDTVLGYCAAVTPAGYVDDISMMVGVDEAGQVVGVQIVDMSETSGIGTKTKNDSFLDQFIGKSGVLTVGENIDGITGATYSSRGVTEGVNMALALDVSLDGVKPVETEPAVIETEPVETQPVETQPAETETEPVETETEPVETETQVPETQAPETTAPETQAPETTAPETIPPQPVTIPETPAPETNPPETWSPETQAPETETEPETVPPETETEPETEFESETEPEWEIETETETAFEPESETEPEPETETEPETELETEPETEFESEFEPETEPETETETKKETTSGSKFPIRH